MNQYVKIATGDDIGRVTAQIFRAHRGALPLDQLREELEGRFSFDPTTVVDRLEVDRYRTSNFKGFAFYPTDGRTVTERGCIRS